MRINDVKVSKNFKLYEFECKDGSNLVKIDPRVIECVQRLRDIVGKPLYINSGYRTPEHNKKIGGSDFSQHVLGKAVDIPQPLGMSVDSFAEMGKKAGFTGIGKYNWGCHFDVRDRPYEFDMR